jgi:DsbC/DsbD-like thiol-disulfide interchange protein
MSAGFKTRRVLTMAFSLALAAGAAALPAAKPEVRAKIVAPPSLPAGTRTVVTVELSVGPGWHVNSHSPADALLIPTDLALATSAGSLSPVRYPAPVERRFSFSDTPLSVYEGVVTFEADLELPAVPGKATLEGGLTYQACNDRQCFAPATLQLESSITITDASAPSHK